ncbi:MAG: WecB/TagA/CpsF family glycosyltransferase, partial [Firmicutes bacterium]|nr:WecB/TagA/CpsF family glycosyltransferase [Bacillota bacterium]
MSDFASTKILGVRVDKVTKAQALETFRQLLDGSRCELIVTPNAEIVEKASKTPQLRRIINEEAALVTPDGVGLIYASKLKGDPIEEKVAGIDFARSAIELCAQLGRSVYLLGSKPGVAEMAAANLEKEIPGLKIAGFRDGYFKEEEEASVVRQINESGADFLCVALGSPKQEYFVIRHRDMLKVKAAAG